VPQAPVTITPAPPPTYAIAEPPADEDPSGVDVFRLIALRNRLAEAIES
jgi:hypothetical protein